MKQQVPELVGGQLAVFNQTDTLVSGQWSVRRSAHRRVARQSADVKSTLSPVGRRLCSCRTYIVIIRSLGADYTNTDCDPLCKKRRQSDTEHTDCGRLKRILMAACKSSSVMNGQL